MSAEGKRGMVEIQFNWIFVLIVGGVILFFFINLSMRHRQLSTQKLAGDLLQDLDLIVAGQSVSVGRSTVLDLPPVELEFTCDAYLILSRASPIRNSIVFSPPTIAGPKLLTWTQEWKMPFRVANFVYLTSSRAKYYFLTENADLEELAEELQRALPIELDITVRPIADADTLIPPAARTVRFVYFTEEDQGIPAIPVQFRDAEAELSALHIVVNEDDADFDAQLIFSTQDPRTGQFVRQGQMPTIGLPALYGAIYTSEFEHYQCSMEKALRRLVVVSTVYAERTAELLPVIREDCQRFFTGAEFDDLAAAADNGLNGDFSDAAFFTPLTNALDLLSRRIEAAAILSCPWLY